MTDSLWLQVTSGRGPVECQIAVAKLVRLIEAEARASGLDVALIGSEPGEAGGLLSALMAIGGPEASAFASRWRGSVKWICRSPVRPAHKRRNWFVGVDALMPPDDASGGLDPRDVAFEAMRASGPGGQHVNKTESAIRATHRPSGVSVVAREERSQAMNRKLALARIALQLQARAEAAEAAAGSVLWTLHDQLERGNPVRTFEGEAFRERR